MDSRPAGRRAEAKGYLLAVQAQWQRGGLLWYNGRKSTDGTVTETAGSRL